MAKKGVKIAYLWAKRGIIGHNVGIVPAVNVKNQVKMVMFSQDLWSVLNDWKNDQK